ncbi:four helix bundle protein [Candidatus Roizmanbacteria bacterium]|nr:four helix bundle protein [Candidatus Roizmanbacteria bacterium]
MKSYKELTVWQKSFQLVLILYKITSKFPRDELYGLTSQIRRAAVAIPSNIAEGYARKFRKEYIQFLSIAYGSGAELETQLLLAKELGYLYENDYRTTSSLLEEVMKMLNKMLFTLRTTNG